MICVMQICALNCVGMADVASDAREIERAQSHVEIEIYHLHSNFIVSCAIIELISFHVKVRAHTSYYASKQWPMIIPYRISSNIFTVNWILGIVIFFDISSHQKNKTILHTLCIDAWIHPHTPWLSKWVFILGRLGNGGSIGIYI